MKYQLTKFNNICKLLLESFKNNSFDILNSNNFPKAHKYNNFPEGNDIDITNELIKYKLNDDISKVILDKHCIKSVKDDEIHGINYINLPKARFFKFVTKCINTSLNNLIKRKKPINLYYDSFRVEEEFKDLNTGYEFKIGFKSEAKSICEIEIRLITIFYSNTHQNREKRKIETSNGKQTSYITQKLFLENIKLSNDILIKSIKFFFI